MGLLETLKRAPPWVRWLLALLPLRVALIPVIPILPEEAYHWNYARHLDWGYFDHPPMIAWAIAAGRLLFGDTAFGIRAVTLLFSAGTSILLARLAKRFYGDAAAVWALILFTFAPVALPVSEAGFPDSPLLFFWTLTLTLAWDAIEGQDGRRWLAAGAALGAAMLSKYTAVFLVPSVFLYLVLSKRDRRWLATPWPYLAGLVALVVFTPVIYWNWKHDWVSFLYQSKGRFDETRNTPGRPGSFLLYQGLAVFALTLPLALVTLARLFRTARAEEQ
ncbi:MAG: glycosyltransferase family 39 protein, partial [Planctomycetes bacterium]|nr:glycosyltransferase family 39 protein [Planctomycetota bacterium]